VTVHREEVWLQLERARSDGPGDDAVAMEAGPEG
jgi:hypothetical protein